MPTTGDLFDKFLELQVTVVLTPDALLGVSGRGFMFAIWNDTPLSARLGRSFIQMSLVSEMSSSSSIRDARVRAVDVTVRERWMVMPLSFGGFVVLRRPQHGSDDSRQLFGTSPAIFCRDALVVPKTMNKKIPGVVPGRRKKKV